jgi:hypothetical protein
MLKEYAAFMSPSKLVTLMGMTLRNNAKALHLCGACHALLTNALAGWQFQSDVSPGEPDARRLDWSGNSAGLRRQVHRIASGPK